MKRIDIVARIEAEDTHIEALRSLVMARTPEDRAAAIRIHLGEEAYQRVVQIRERRRQGAGARRERQ